MKYFKLVILLLILWNLPSFALAHLNPILGTILSYATFFFIIVYYLKSKREWPIMSYIYLGLLYFIISSLVDSQNTGNYFTTFIKYFIFVILGVRLVKDTESKDIYVILLLGALSIIYESIFITDVGGRFSGFYLNPNTAGFICIMGYCLLLSIKRIWLRVIGEILFTIAGIVTFSRTFLLIWAVINIGSLLISFKNVYKIIMGLAVFILLLSLGERFDYNTKRLNAFSNVLDGEISDELVENSRDQTWSMYYDKILENPIFGSGYLSFSGRVSNGESPYFDIGVHNTPLLVLGEAGVFTLALYMWIYGSLIVKGMQVFRRDPTLFLMSISLLMYMLTSHNYFDNYLILFASLWLYFRIEDNYKPIKCN